MNYNIKTIPKFDKQLKKLISKFPSFKTDFINFIESLRENPQQGVGIGSDCYKIRIAISAKGKGKSGGARIITHLILSEENIYLISIYDKSNHASITDKELLQLLKDL